MKLPQSFIDEVLSRIDLIDVIEPRLTLKKTGKTNYSGLCPFHQEKSPSFSVSQAKQFYYCFGCKASGNAIGFLMAYEKLSFLEAVEMLAAQASIPMPKVLSNAIDERQPHLDLLETCSQYFQEHLRKNPTAESYLQQRRLSPDMIKTFKLGFAPGGWDNLQKNLGRTAVARELLLHTGMLVTKSDKSHYDRFRNRIMFPIRNRRGQTVGFGGRALDSQLPKYLNSPETTLFHKSRELYGLFEALQANQDFKRIIVVEGYLDVIALHQHGFTQTVATLGTAISQQHIQTLLRHTSSLIFCFDGDLAGKTAAWRALEIALPLMHTGIDVQFLFLPNGEDPDSFIHKEGPAGFLEKLKETTSLIDFFFNKLRSETDLDTLPGKTRFVYKVDHYLQKQPKGIFQELMYEHLSSLVGLNLEKIEEILSKPKESGKIKVKPTITPQRLIPPVKLALCLLLQKPMLLTQVVINETLYNSKVEGTELLQRIITLIQEDPSKTTGSLLEYLKEDKEKDLFIELAAQDLLIPDEAWQEELQGALARVVGIDVDQHIQSLLIKGKKEGLSTEEKKLLQNLLITQKQL